ncbi:MAG: hypothetical protein BWY68_00480 [bacterium ADurb.Bin400]|nr:MAG: hypothetical protein BWY68_00480 [bacterium ADurb.Bin400]
MNRKKRIIDSMFAVTLVLTAIALAASVIAGPLTFWHLIKWPSITYLSGFALVNIVGMAWEVRHKRRATNGSR